MSSLVESATSFLSSLSWSDVWKGLLGVYLIANVKVWPLGWHVRFYTCVLRHFYIRRNDLPTPAQIFSPATWTSYSPVLESDFNLHKSNSTYFSDTDIARTYLLAHLTKKAFADRKKVGKKALRFAVAAVSGVFMKEIPVYKRYKMSSRLITWDDRKWFFVVTHFHGIGKDGKPVLYASLLTKYCFKEGRKTVPPQEAFIECGILPPLEVGGGGADTGTSSAVEPKESAEALARRDFERHAPGASEGSYWTWDRINEERRRGQRLADCILGLDALADEFRLGDGSEEGFVSIGSF